ncbi:MAG: DUF2304 domain-containing protein [Clostridiales bacterium]|nr:DUF2304 domain-containing protein [Clostridiales bacterium]
MDYRIQIFFIVVVFIFLLFIVYLLKTQKLNLKYTLLWIFATIILLIISIFPQIMYGIANILGIQTPINVALILAGIFVVLILISITSIVSELNKKIRSLVQELSLLKKEFNELKVLEYKHEIEDDKE